MLAILDNLRSAYNVGSILRTCDALGIKKVFLSGITPGLDNKKTLKTSLGAEKNLSIVYFPNITTAIKQAKRDGYQIISLEIEKKSISISKLKTQDRVALVIGNEVSGISQEAKELSDLLIKIPMRGVKESLNVSVAFAIAAYEIINHRLES